MSIEDRHVSAKGGMVMPEGTPREHELSPEEARRRLETLRTKERAGTLTVNEAGEITKLLVILGESEMGHRGERAA